jgi:Protein of unknown function (DUF3558)
MAATTAPSSGLPEKPNMRRYWIVLAFVAGLVAACGGAAATGGLPTVGTQNAPGATTNPTSGTASALNPCTLLTTDEAATALGEAVDPAKASSPSAPYCYFYSHANADNSVEIYLTKPTTFLPNQSSIAGVFEVTKVSGVGDAAYYVNDVSAGTVGLSVKKGETTFVVSVVLKGATIAALEAKEKILAIAIAGRV